MAEPATILLVDDDKDFLELERRILESRGYKVICFSDTQAALDALGASEPADTPVLVVTDLMMKTLDSGFTFARALKADPRTAALPVIIVSAVSSQKGFDFRPRTDSDLAAMGADAFFDKPVAPEALLAKVKELLG
jgi:putative two-component system response regulator